MKKNVIKKLFRKLHKYIGYIFSFFIMHLTITGILLLYPKILGVEEGFINNTFFLEKYNMATVKDVIMADTHSNELVIINNSFYINNQFIDTLDYEVKFMIFKSSSNKLYLFYDYGIEIYFFEETNSTIELSDIKSLIVNDKIVKVGSKDGTIILDTEGNSYMINKDKILIYYDKYDDIDWFKIKKTPVDLAIRYLKIHQGKGVSIHRIITELHNGKFFGAGVVFLFLLSSASIIFLVISSFIFGINFKKKNK